jgi:hypothetical protein
MRIRINGVSHGIRWARFWKTGGLGHDSGWQKKEVIDFSIAHGESQAAWDTFLSDLYKRRLRAEGMELMVIDGGKGLQAALPFVYPVTPVQRFWLTKPETS